MFVTPREEFEAYLDDAKDKPFMAKFYERQRRRLNVLMEGDDPEGGQWSFDHDNRKKLPKKQAVPETAWATPTGHVADVRAVIAKHFDDHPGTLPDDERFLAAHHPSAGAGLVTRVFGRAVSSSSAPTKMR